ncbi:MAG: RNA methyltransferase [Bacteroidota bacterium]
MHKEFVTYLSQFISENRKKRFEQVLQSRTRHITVVLEDIYQPHNASAVLRSCDCFGIQDVHIIENKNKYTTSPDVEMGSSKWLTMYRYNSKKENTLDCIQWLKKNKYRIIVTSPHPETILPCIGSGFGQAKTSCNIEELDITEKTALFFGTEMRGATSDAFEQADGFVKIPMVGFTESLNISVSAAISIFMITLRLRKSSVNWKLSKEEETEIKLQWLKNSIQKSELIKEEEFLKTNICSDKIREH